MTASYCLMLVYGHCYRVNVLISLASVQHGGAKLHKKQGRLLTTAICYAYRMMMTRPLR